MHDKMHRKTQKPQKTHNPCTQIFGLLIRIYVKLLVNHIIGFCASPFFIFGILLREFFFYTHIVMLYHIHKASVPIRINSQPPLSLHY